MLAKDGVDALEKLQEFKPDVMLVDIEMPRMDGFDLIRNVRSDSRVAKTPIIMITSRTASKHRNYAMEARYEYYGKPFQEQQLLESIENLSAKTPRKNLPQPINRTNNHNQTPPGHGGVFRYLDWRYLLWLAEIKKALAVELGLLC